MNAARIECMVTGKRIAMVCQKLFEQLREPGDFIPEWIEPFQNLRTSGHLHNIRTSSNMQLLL
jgi:hypothetical protein